MGSVFRKLWVGAAALLCFSLFGMGANGQQAVAAGRSGQTAAAAQAARGPAETEGKGERSEAGQSAQGPGVSGELLATWISYLDWAKLPQDEAGFRSAVDAMMDRCRDAGFNAVFVHAHSHSDSYYPDSAYFPTSKFIAQLRAQAPGFDPFAYMIEAAHARGLQFHAWFNPYRVTGYMVSWQDVADDSPAKQWWNSPAQRRNVLRHDGQYYLNPSSQEVRERLLGAVRELLQAYDVDGIHFDDYFYPEVNDGLASRAFDKPEYESSGSGKTLAQWRRDNVSQLVRSVHEAVRELRPDAVFGVSPQGYLPYLRSDSKLFVDIDAWVQSDAYVDYVMPQIYWGFEARTAEGRLAPYAFERNLQSWIDLTKDSPVKLYIGLALYKGGTNQRDGNAVSEWLRYDDIIAREVAYARASGQVDGFGFYSYQSLSDRNNAAEAENLRRVLR